MRNGYLLKEEKVYFELSLYCSKILTKIFDNVLYQRSERVCKYIPYLKC